MSDLKRTFYIDMILLNGFIALFLNLFSSVFICASEETQVSCVFNESCVLPCSFQSGLNPGIHWYKTPEGVPVHIYFYGQDQVQHQNQDFKDRTSLFVDQISRGNASLLLREVKVQDEGIYRCYTRTVNTDSKESLINLRVRAPVGDVVLEQRGDELICSSTDIYPKPDVTWSGPDGTEAKTEVSEKENKLYFIHSSVRLSDGQEHSCNVSTGYSWRRATLKQQDPVTASDSKTTLHCVDSNSTIKSIVWKFNQTQTILNQTGTDRVYNESWRQFVEEVSESSLTLKNLDSGLSGVYSCVLSSDRETLISDTVLSVSDATESDHTTVVLVLGIILGVVVLAVLGVFLKKQMKSLLFNTNKENPSTAVIHYKTNEGEGNVEYTQTLKDPV